LSAKFIAIMLNGGMQPNNGSSGLFIALFRPRPALPLMSKVADVFLGKVIMGHE